MIVSTNDLDLDAVRLRLALAGYAYVSGLPEGFDYPSALAELGPLMPQYGDVLVRDVKPDPAISNDVRSSANMAELTPHTEWYEFPGLPPRYVALWCVQPAAGDGGETTLADGHAMLDRFTADELAQLAAQSWRWRSRPTLAREGVRQVVHHPTIDIHQGQLVLRFSTLDLLGQDELARRYVATGSEHFEAAKISIKIAKGAILLWDNWRMMHARNAFSDPNRHLCRVLIGVAN
ncbi:MAG: hypothetical protein GEU94_08705 [Micromonosporaceae bacterium]|nr:hypothetical protein [Micromonosporaceae bacterium]